VLLKLSRALDVRVEYFFRQQSVELKSLEFRKRSSLRKGEQVKITADVYDRLERWKDLDDVFPQASSQRFVVPESVPSEITNYDDIEDAALEVRESWDLGHNPIPDLIDTLEENGIRVVVTPHTFEGRFDGLSAVDGDTPVVVVGEDWPGDRQRFTLAHELGHLILHRRISKSINEERACNRFAGAFLAPKDIVYELLGRKRRWIEPRELLILKHEYGLSIAGWAYRAFDLGILDKNSHGKFMGYLRKNGWHKIEPGPQYPAEKSRLFELRIYHALAEDWIGESRAAELLSIPLAELHACRKMECPQDAAYQ
jgi:Zn-dependent peptidase ImmA (M78 family)